MSPWKKTVYASFVAQVLSILGFACALPFLPLFIKEDLGVTDPGELERWAGLVLGAAGLTLGIFGPIWGVVADRFGRKPMVLRSMFGGAIILGLMSFTQTVPQLLICRLLQGIVTGTVTASTALVASVAPRERSGFAMGLMQSAAAVGMSLGPLVGGLVSDLVSHRAAFRVAAFLLMMGGVLVKLTVREDFTPPESSAKEHRGSFGEVLVAVGFLAAVFALFATRFANSVPTPIFPFFVEALRGTSEKLNTITGALLGTYGVAAAIASVVFGRYGDTWGHKRMLVAGCLFTALAAALHALAQSVLHLFLLRVLLGLGAGAIMPAAASIIRNAVHDKNIGKAYGVTTTFTSAAWALGPLAGGYLAASVGVVYPDLRYRAPFLLMALVLVVGAAIVTWRVRSDGPNVWDSRVAADSEER